MFLPIHNTFGPLATKEHVVDAFLLQFQPWRWQTGPETDMLRETLGSSFGGYTFLFSSGREALLALLYAMEISDGDEVILQGYTCVVLPNAIKAAGGIPVYADISRDTLNLDIAAVQEVMTPRTRAIICQHTFGIPADTAALRRLCDEHQLALIEDCAHIVPTDAESVIGKLGDTLLFSFGRDKAFSGVTGGAILVKHKLLSERLKLIERAAFSLSSWKILNLIDYPLRYQFAKWIWKMKIAKLYLRCIRLIGFLPAIVTKKEKHGEAGRHLHHIPNACAALALRQGEHLPQINEHRRSLTFFYKEVAKQHNWPFPSAIKDDASLQKFPLLVQHAEQIRTTLKEEQIYLEDGWSGAVVNPRSADQTLAGYIPGSCPVAEEVAQSILSLPTHPTMTAAQAHFLIETIERVIDN